MSMYTVEAQTRRFLTRAWRLNTLAWLRYYGVAEVAAFVTALACATVLNVFTTNVLLVSLSAWSGGVGYYSALLFREMRIDWRVCQQQQYAYGPCGALRTAHKLVVEFSGAEVLDSLLVSPLCMYVCLNIVSNLHFAVTLSETMSTLFFYAVVTTVKTRRAGRT